MSGTLTLRFNAGPGSEYATPRDAKRARDARARELRKGGMSVVCKKWGFSDLARCVSYTIEARTINDDN